MPLGAGTRLVRWLKSMYYKEVVVGNEDAFTRGESTQWHCGHDLQVTEHGTPRELLSRRAGQNAFGESTLPVQDVFHQKMDSSFPGPEREFVFHVGDWMRLVV